MAVLLSYEFWKINKNSFFVEQLRMATSQYHLFKLLRKIPAQFLSYELLEIYKNNSGWLLLYFNATHQSLERKPKQICS